LRLFKKLSGRIAAAILPESLAVPWPSSLTDPCVSMREQGGNREGTGREQGGLGENCCSNSLREGLPRLGFAQVFRFPPFFKIEKIDFLLNFSTHGKKSKSPDTNHFREKVALKSTLVDFSAYSREKTPVSS